MSHEEKPELDLYLLNDDELVALAKRDFARSAPKPDEVMEERIWQRLQRSTTQPRRLWLTGAMVLAASCLLTIGLSHLVNLDQNPEQVTSKSGGALEKAQLSLAEGHAPGLVRLHLQTQSDAAVYAVINANKDILWQGRAAEFPQTFERPQTAQRRLCLVQAEDPSDLEKRISILRSLPDIPQDLNCVEVP